MRKQFKVEEETVDIGIEIGFQKPISRPMSGVTMTLKLSHGEATSSHTWVPYWLRSL